MSASKQRAVRNELQSLMDLQRPVERYKNGGQFITSSTNSKIRLINADSTATPAGVAYYDLHHVAPPLLYDYEQPLTHDMYVDDWQVYRSIT